MYNDYFDFPEPSTGDIVFEEIKKVLLGTLKEEIKNELEHLHKENEELRPYKEERDRMQYELLNTKRDCERRIIEAERKAKEMTLKELFGECIVDAWKVKREYIKGPKCDKCDENRKLHYTTPRGKAMTEDCDCADSTVQFVPTPAIMTRFKVNPNARCKYQESADNFYDKPVYRWYTTEWAQIEDGTEFVVDSDTMIGQQRFADRGDTPFDKLSEWHAVFTSKERCQEFCDYLAEKANHK